MPFMTPSAKAYNFFSKGKKGALQSQQQQAGGAKGPGADAEALVQTVGSSAFAATRQKAQDDARRAAMFAKTQDMVAKAIDSLMAKSEKAMKELSPSKSDEDAVSASLTAQAAAAKKKTHDAAVEAAKKAKVADEAEQTIKAAEAASAKRAREAEEAAKKKAKLKQATDLQMSQLQAQLDSLKAKAKTLTSEQTAASQQAKAAQVAAEKLGKMGAKKGSKHKAL
jgi:DNA repair exonuclease SbcCD ATPase subunit